MSTICAPGLPFFLGAWIMPSTRFRVVWGLGLTIASFSPASAFSNVDLPALGRPIMVTKPERKDISKSASSAENLRLRLLPAHPGGRSLATLQGAVRLL